MKSSPGRQVFLCSLKWERARGWPLPPPCRRECEGGVWEVEHTAASSLCTCSRPHLYVSNSCCEDEQEIKSMRHVFWWFYFLFLHHSGTFHCSPLPPQFHPNAFFFFFLVKQRIPERDQTNQLQFIGGELKLWSDFPSTLLEDLTWWLLHYDAFFLFISLGMSYAELGYSYSAAPQVSTLCSDAQFLTNCYYSLYFIFCENEQAKNFLVQGASAYDDKVLQSLMHPCDF